MGQIFYVDLKIGVVVMTEDCYRFFLKHVYGLLVFKEVPRLAYSFVIFFTEPAEMNSPEVAKTPGGGSGSGKDDGMLNGHKEGEANPFAEYMWMENEEEYNRQVSVTSNVDHGSTY